MDATAGLCLMAMFRAAVEFDVRFIVPGCADHQ